jgi:hypothetical protein
MTSSQNTEMKLTDFSPDILNLINGFVNENFENKKFTNIISNKGVTKDYLNHYYTKEYFNKGDTYGKRKKVHIEMKSIYGCNNYVKIDYAGNKSVKYPENYYIDENNRGINPNGTPYDKCSFNVKCKRQLRYYNALNEMKKQSRERFRMCYDRKFKTLHIITFDYIAIDPYNATIIPQDSQYADCLYDNYEFEVMGLLRFHIKKLLDDKILFYRYSHNPSGKRRYEDKLLKDRQYNKIFIRSLAKIFFDSGDDYLEKLFDKEGGFDNYWLSYETLLPHNEVEYTTALNEETLNEDNIDLYNTYIKPEVDRLPTWALEKEEKYNYI